MTEFQANSPIDELFRKTIENLPDTPGESGWDTPSDRVWQQVQANMPKAQQNGWSAGSIMLLSALVIALFAALYWWSSRPAQKPASVPAAPPALEQPSAPLNVTPAETQQVTPVKNEKETLVAKPGNNNTPSAATEKPAKPSIPTAEPLPGSKNAMPPNSTEAKKKKSEE